MNTSGSRMSQMLHKPAFFSLLLAILLLSPCLPAQETITSDYYVQPGDVLDVSVWKEEDLQRTVLVRPDGRFSFPLVGDINAVGKTVEQLRLALTQKLARFVPDLTVTVSVDQIDGNRIYVIGQVNNPGSFIVNPRVDVMQALSLAQGTTPFADLDHIVILRRKTDGAQVALKFEYKDVARGRSLDQNIILQSGDIVVVP